MSRALVYIVAFIFILASCAALIMPRPAIAATASGLKDEISSIAGPYALKLPAWEISNLIQPLRGVTAQKGEGADFSHLDDQIQSVLRDQGISVIPPVLIRLERPPLLLVVSPRNKIEYFDRILLSPDLSLSQVESLENRLDGLNMSSLVVELGGLAAAYPAIVYPDMRARDVIDAASEEWSHQFLALHPLGFLYLLDSLGINQSPEVIEMNETLAGMMAREIGGKVYENYYKNTDGQQISGANRSFDFDKEMRETRKNTDAYLAAGDIDGAEQYMNERCLVFNANGYAIRKLNQAYFAFHGIYGQDPGAVSPVYSAMQKLRAKYSSLAQFVATASKLTNYGDLQKAVTN